MVPLITVEQMERVVRRHASTAQISVEHINPVYGSWRMMVLTGLAKLEFSWGPLSGFGVSDFAVLQNDDPFTPFDFALDSLRAAETYLAGHVSLAT